MVALANPKPNSIQTFKRCKRQLAASIKAIKGGLAVCLNGYWRPATGALGEIAKARFVETVDNTAGAAGAKSADVEFFNERTVMLFVNDGANAVVVADREKACSILDDQTVRAFTPALADAGIVFDVTSEGVWVEVDAGSPPDAFAVPNIQSGTATLVAGTVTVSGVSLTATSRITASMKDRGAGALTGVVGIEIPAAQRNVGAGTFVLRMIDAAGAVVASAVSTVEYHING
jgi:hypothetical protein